MKTKTDTPARNKRTHDAPTFKTDAELYIEVCSEDARSIIRDGLLKASKEGKPPVAVTLTFPAHLAAYARYQIVELTQGFFSCVATCETKDEAIAKLQALRRANPRGPRMQVYGMDEQGRTDGYGLLHHAY